MLSKKQNEILELKDKIIFVNSAAASGKTACLTEKIKQSIELNKKVVAFTFTNMAAAEIKNRLSIENNENVFIGTIHSYCLYLLMKNGIKEALKYVKDENFDELFKLINENQYCIENIDICLLDEGQDSNQIQLNFIFDLLCAKEYFVVFDLRQCIYEWNGSKPKLLMDYGKKLNAKFYSLNENYRNGENILNFSKRIINKTGLPDDSIPMKLDRGSVTEVSLLYNAIDSYLARDTNYKEWAILARTNKEINDICLYLKKKKIPFDSFKQGDLKREELVKKMSQNTVKVLTVHSAKGLEWDNVIVTGMRFWNEEEYRISYVAATRARKKLYWHQPSKKTIKKW